MKTSPDSRGQTNIDFVIAVTVFVGAVVFAVQFVGSSADPFLSPSEETQIEPHAASERMYMSMSGGKSGSLDLRYLVNSSGHVKNQSVLSEEFGIDADGMSLKVTDGETGDVVKLGGNNLTTGGPVPDLGSGVSEVTRIGHTETNGTVRVTMRVW